MISGQGKVAIFGLGSRSSMKLNELWKSNITFSIYDIIEKTF